MNSLGLTGEETFEFTGITELVGGRTPKTVKVTAGTSAGSRYGFR